MKNPENISLRSISITGSSAETHRFRSVLTHTRSENIRCVRERLPETNRVWRSLKKNLKKNLMALRLIAKAERKEITCTQQRNGILIYLFIFIYFYIYFSFCVVKCLSVIQFLINIFHNVFDYF